MDAVLSKQDIAGFVAVFLGRMVAEKYDCAVGASAGR
jgi:hypothetical protein